MPWPSAGDRGRHTRRWGTDGGSLTAEFAVALPAVVLLFACCLACLQLAGTQLRLQDAAADVARSVARGGAAATGEMPAATVAVIRRGDLVCARLSLHTSAPLALTLSATSCALGGGA